MRFQRSLVGAALAVLIVVAVAATAFAAAPKKGAKFKGTLATSSGPLALGKFHAPVSFKVSSSGTQLVGFKYGALGCFGGGGFGNRNPFTLPGVVKSFGPISVSAIGSFTAPPTKSTYTSSGGTGKSKFTSKVTTTSSLAGAFTSAKRASGTITFSQKSVYNGRSSKCGPAVLTFSAKA
ncbi:MAG: hypothetical protein M3065_08215 [Actinomycetota bacterium]|nr:hypothetical protein [Actinomycetota bacterium]